MKKLMRNKLLLVIVCTIIVLLIAGIAALIYINGLDKAYDSSKSDTINVTVEMGSTTEDIGTLLQEEGIIESSSDFKFFSKVKGYDGKYQAGTYALAPSMTLSEIAEIIISGKTNNITFTIPEGYTIYQMADKLSEEGIVDREKFVSLLTDGNFSYDFLSDAQSGKNHLEGYLFPETYTVEFGADEETIIKTMLNQFDTVFTEEFKARAEELGYSLNEIMVIASIIERETQVDEERGKVSSVIYNRLKEGMPLQMCSTVQYILGEQKEILSNADTQIESPYNTYINQGLPPGPICCPGLASIEAALYPDETDYLYFVVSDKLDGTQKFSSDYNQFLKDKEDYYNALEQQE